MRWLSINQVNQLLKDKLFEIESGKIFERNSRNEVGTISNGMFSQKNSYIPPPFIIERLDTFDNDWNNSGRNW